MVTGNSSTQPTIESSHPRKCNLNNAIRKRSYQRVKSPTAIRWTILFIRKKEDVGRRCKPSKLRGTHTHLHTQNPPWEIRAIFPFTRSNSGGSLTCWGSCGASASPWWRPRSQLFLFGGHTSSGRCGPSCGLAALCLWSILSSKHRPS